MKHSIEITTTTQHRETIEVDFPIYRKLDLLLDEADVQHYTRMQEDGTTFHLTRDQPYSGDHVKFEFSIRKGFNFDSRSSADYNLGRGEYACTPEEFFAVVKEAQAQLSTFPKE